MSVMIKLTPIEIKNLMRDFCDTYYNISIGILKHSDPDRFINLN